MHGDGLTLFVEIVGSHSEPVRSATLEDGDAVDKRVSKPVRW